jgi:hypothetical protein
VALGQEGVSQDVVGLRAGGIELDRPEETGNCGIEAMQFEAGYPEIEVDGCVIRIQTGGFLQAWDGFGKSAEVLERIAELVVRLGQAGIEILRRAEFRDRLIHPTEGAQRPAAVEMIDRRLWTGSDGLRHQPLRLLLISLMLGNQAQKMERVGLSGMGLEHLAVEYRCLGKLSRPMEDGRMFEDGARVGRRASGAFGGRHPVVCFRWHPG